MRLSKSQAVVLALVSSATAASAVTGADVIGPFKNAICEIFGTIIPIAIVLVLAAYAAVLWIYSAEDPSMRQRAKHMFVIIAVGVIAIRLAKPFIETIFGISMVGCP